MVQPTWFSNLMKPFIATPAVNVMSNFIDTPAFRQMLSVHADDNGKLKLQIGPSKKFSIPLEHGITGLTAMSGVMHIKNVFSSPLLTMVVNEMIDALGPALRKNYENKEGLTDQDKDDIEKALTKFAEKPVKIEYDSLSDLYYFHHHRCFAQNIHFISVKADGKKSAKGDKKKGGKLANEAKGFTLKDALMMEALPADHCSRCSKLVKNWADEYRVIKENDAGATKSDGKITSPADAFAHLHKDVQAKIDQCYLLWKRRNPDDALKIDVLSDRITTRAEADRIAMSADRALAIRYTAEVTDVKLFVHLISIIDAHETMGMVHELSPPDQARFSACLEAWAHSSKRKYSGLTKELRRRLSGNQVLFVKAMRECTSVTAQYVVNDLENFIVAHEFLLSGEKKLKETLLNLQTASRLFDEVKEKHLQEAEQKEDAGPTFSSIVQENLDKRKKMTWRDHLLEIFFLK